MVFASMHGAASVRTLRLGLAFCTSALCAACSEQAVLELFPGADDCSATNGALGAAGAPGEPDECLAYQDALIHRYSFNMLGATANDSVGQADGALVNTTITGAGKLDLAGSDSDQYVNLPNGLVSELKDATFETWVNWNGGDVWQRIFDFGNSYEGEDVQGGGESYLFLTPTHSFGSLWLAYSLAGPEGETVVNAGVQLPTGATSHVAAVVDDTNDTLALYLNGNLMKSVAFSGELSAIADVNNWLGRSQFIIDHELGATLYEFRIYDRALTAQELATSYAAGPDPVSLEP